MTGPRRKRRASSSSVETVDENQIRWQQETSVLKTIPRSVDSNDWEAFELRDVVVLNQDGTTLENALHVGTRGPFIVRGNLYLERDQKIHLMKKTKNPTPIEIRKSNLYSLDLVDGQPVIWVSGKCGWYEIKPSPTYQHVYNEMCEAIKFYFYLLDIYTERALKRDNNKSSAALSQILLKYTLRVGDGATLADVTARCLRHSMFFVWHFGQEKPDHFAWSSTAVFKFLHAKKPEMFGEADHWAKNPVRVTESPAQQSRRSGSAVTALPSRTRAKSSGSAIGGSNMEAVDTKDFASKRSSRSRSNVHIDLTSPASSKSPAAAESSKPSSKVAQKPVVDVEMLASDEEPLDDAPETDSAFSSVLDVLEWAYKEIAGKPKGMVVSTTLNKIYFAYKFPTYKDGTPGCHKKPVEEILHYNAQRLLETIDKAKYEGHDIYGWLEGLAKTKFSPLAFKASELPYTVVPRRQMPRKSNADQHSGKNVVSFTSDKTVVSTPPARPRVGKKPGHTPGKKSSLRLASSSKRPHSDLESDSDTEMSAAKRSHYFSGDDDVDDSADVSSGNGVTEDTSQVSDEPIKIVLRAERIPSATPNGLDGAWSCEEEGCDCVVRGGDAEECQRRIQEHFNKHKQQTTRVDLAVAESRGLLPINHLLDKIKKLGESAQQSAQLIANGELVPQAIKRKLIV